MSRSGRWAAPTAARTARRLDSSAIVSKSLGPEICGLGVDTSIVCVNAGAEGYLIVDQKSRGRCPQTGSVRSRRGPLARPQTEARSGESALAATAKRDADRDGLEATPWAAGTGVVWGASIPGGRAPAGPAQNRGVDPDHGSRGPRPTPIRLGARRGREARPSDLFTSPLMSGRTCSIHLRGGRSIQRAGTDTSTPAHVPCSPV